MFKNIPFEVGNCVKFTIACHMLRFMRLGYFITAVIKYFYSHQIFVFLVSPSNFNNIPGIHRARDPKISNVNKHYNNQLWSLVRSIDVPLTFESEFSSKLLHVIKKDFP